jgi:hypothetical protein
MSLISFDKFHFDRKVKESIIIILNKIGSTPEQGFLRA